MPRQSPCAYPHCSVLTPIGVSYCEKHAYLVEQQRGTPAARGYGHHWRRMRQRVLREEPVCCICGAIAECVDHIQPLSSGGTHSRDNLQALCTRCHSIKTVKEDGGFGNGVH